VTHRRVALQAGAAALAVALFPSLALAHGKMQIGEFYTGLTEPVFHPESLFVVLALLLWSAQRGEPLVVRAPFAFAAAIVAGSAMALAGWGLPGSFWIARGGTLLLALLVAARLGLPELVALAIAVGIGIAAGHEATWPDRASLARPWLYAIGLGTAVLVAWGYVTSFSLRFRAFWAQVAVRIVGSWIATVTLLVSALALARR